MFFTENSIELRIIQGAVKTALFQQRSMVAHLGYFPVLKHYDLVGIFYGGKTVGYYKAGSASAKLVHRLLNLNFGTGIHVGGSFVKDQHLGIRNHGTGDGYKLALTL